MSGRSKFNVNKDSSRRTFDNIVFDSELEMKYYRDFILPKIQLGEIKNYSRQKRYVLQPSYIHEGKKILPIEYKADFYIEFSNGKEMVVDTKGFAEPLAILKKKMFWFVYPNIDYKWVTFVKKFGGWIDFDECKKLRKQEKQEKKIKEKKD